MHRFIVLRRVLAALLGVATAALVATDLSTLHRHARELGPERTVLVATHDLALGHAITANDVAERRSRAGLLPRDALARSAPVVGRIVVVPILDGAVVAERALASAQRSGLDGVVPVGSRALRLTPVAAPALEPGELVDVLVAFDASPGTTVAAHAALVIAVDDPPDSFEAPGTDAVTLLVSADDAPRVADAVAAGHVVLALAPPEEAEMPGTAP